MARKPNVLCAGTCGRLLWPGKGALPAGERMCRECRADVGGYIVGTRGFEACAGGCGRKVKGRAGSAPPGQRMCRECHSRLPRDARACSVPGCDGKHDARGYCKRHYNELIDREAKRRRDRARTKLRRALTHTTDAEVIHTDVVGERDNWRCFCKRRIDRTKTYPHPRSPSVDHIEPLSLGGAHTYVNVRIAHLDCNMRRSNRMANEQLALFG